MDKRCTFEKQYTAGAYFIVILILGMALNLVQLVNLAKFLFLSLFQLILKKIVSILLSTKASDDYRKSLYTCAEFLDEKQGSIFFLTAGVYTKSIDGIGRLSSIDLGKQDFSLSFFYLLKSFNSLGQRLCHTRLKKSVDV